MKNVFCLLSMILLISGCTTKKVEDGSLQQISQPHELIEEKHEFAGFQISIFYDGGCWLEKIIVSHDSNKDIIDLNQLKKIIAIQYHGVMFTGARDSTPIMDILTYAPGTGVTDYRLHRFELGSKIKYIGSYKLYELYAIPENGTKEPAQLKLISLMKLQINENEHYGLYFKPVEDERLKRLKEKRFFLKMSG